MDLLLADGQGLQRTVADVARPPYPIALLPRAEGAGKLRESEDPLAIELPQLFLAHGLQQTDVVGLLCLLAASPPELAQMAMRVERQPRRLAACLEPPGLVQHLLRLAVELRVQPDLAQPALGTAGDQPCRGPQPLHALEHEPEDGKQQLLLTADLVAVIVEYGDVVVITHL